MFFIPNGRREKYLRNFNRYICSRRRRESSEVENMEIDKQKMRISIAILLGIILACFGVFIFSDFQYRGQTLEDHIFPLLFSGDFNIFWDGFYQLVGSGLLADWFGEFTSDNIATSSFFTIFFGETIWPAVLTWFFTGFLICVIVHGNRRGYTITATVLGIIMLLWIIGGLFAGADMKAILFHHVTTTLSELFTVIVFSALGATIGNLASGPSGD